MMFPLFICLISAFTCEIYRLKKYQSITTIKDGYGLIVLELDKFDKGDKIYITYSAYNGTLNNIIYYNFDDIFPENETIELKEHINNYKNGSFSHRNVVSNGHGGYTTYNTYDRFYYYKFEKKTNNKYLVMRYSFDKGKINYLKVENTRLDDNTTNIIVTIASVVGFVFIFGFILFFVCRQLKYRKKMHSYDINFDAKKNKDLALPPVSPIIPPQPMDMNYNIPVGVNYDQDKPYYIQNNMPTANNYPQSNNDIGSTYNYTNNLNNLPTTNDSTYNTS